MLLQQVDHHVPHGARDRREPANGFIFLLGGGPLNPKFVAQGRALGLTLSSDCVQDFRVRARELSPLQHNAEPQEPRQESNLTSHVSYAYWKTKTIWIPYQDFNSAPKGIHIYNPMSTLTTWMIGGLNKSAYSKGPYRVHHGLLWWLKGDTNWTY